MSLLPVRGSTSCLSLVASFRFSLLLAFFFFFLVFFFFFFVLFVFPEDFAADAPLLLASASSRSSFPLGDAVGED